MSLDYSAIGLRIREFRVKKHLTQEDIANKMNVSIAFLSRIERGTARINLPRLSELCDILEVTEGEILNGVAPLRSNYLSKEFNNLLRTCPKDKLKLFYKIAQILADDSQELNFKKNYNLEDKLDEFELKNISHTKTTKKQKSHTKKNNKFKK